jgi:hypothetical protein
MDALFHEVIALVSDYPLAVLFVVVLLVIGLKSAYNKHFKI